MHKFKFILILLVITFGANIKYSYSAFNYKTIENEKFISSPKNVFSYSDKELRISDKIKYIPGDDQLVAVILAFFFGTLGIHRFYLGYIGIGIIQLVLSLTIIGLLITIPWAFVDFIFIFLNKLLPKNGYYNKSIYF